MYYLFFSPGGTIGECHRMVPQSPRLRLLAIGDRCQHSDAQSTVPGALCSSGGKYYRKNILKLLGIFPQFFFIPDLIRINIYMADVLGGKKNETRLHRSSVSDP